MSISDDEVEQISGILFASFDLSKYGYRLEDVNKVSRDILSAAAKVRAIREGDGEWKGAPALADVRRLIAEAGEKVEPIVGGPEGETIMAYKIPTGLWLMLQARVRNLLDHLPIPAATGGEPQEPLTLSPLHIDLLKRGSQGQFIWFHDKAYLHTSEMYAVGELCRAGLAKGSEPSGIPGPPEMPGFEITDAGRSALAATTGGEGE